MIARLLRVLWQIRNWERIPKLPRGFYATRYEDVDSAERRVMARLGSRDIAGVRLAMRRHRAKTVDDLVAILEHQRPRRNVWMRFWRLLQRMAGGETTQPYKRDLARLSHRHRNSEVAQRLEDVKNTLRD
jgi:hypothetical protein